MRKIKNRQQLQSTNFLERKFSQQIMRQVYSPQTPEREERIIQRNDLVEAQLQIR